MASSVFGSLANDHSSSNQTIPSNLPLRPIPGGYGLPFFGPINDRLDYFYNQGPDEFFKSRIEKYKSTVFRTNMPPGPFVSSDSKVIALLDAASFPVLFDTSKVEKKNVFTGTYMPSTDFTGGYRVCSYLDPSESKHSTLKSFILSTLASLHDQYIPTFRSSLSGLFSNLENALSDKGEADFNSLSDNMSFSFVFKLFCGVDPSKTSIGSNGPKTAETWLLPQLAPITALGIKFLPSAVEDFILHTFPIPFFTIKSEYKKLYDAFYESAGSILDKAEKSGIKRDEACHNLVFFCSFNSYGGYKILFPALFKWVGTAGESLHRRLADEIRTVVKQEGGVTFSALEKMPLTKSVVYETLRIEPPVQFQYGRAKKNLIIESHDSSYLVLKGEMLFGYQPFATKDAKVFTNPEEFVGDRFVGDGEKLIQNVFWSNGRETEDPTVGNKQCPGKGLVVLLARLILVEFFLRYDTFTGEYGTILLGPSVTFKSLTKAKGT